MEEIEVRIGEVFVWEKRRYKDLRIVQFRGRPLAEYRELWSMDGSAGAAYTLYETEDGRKVVYAEEWSRRGESELLYFDLIEVTLKDLDTGGEFEELGYRAGIARPLTLDEALEWQQGGG